MPQDSQAKIRKSSPALAAPRKRRKRTVVTGAAHDCFTCSRSGSPCDRRRPYCSQCLEHGRDCLGYKTTLTWGVGVASRGKFRGLSLPVTSAQPTPGKPKSRRVSGHQKSQVTTTSTVSNLQPNIQTSPDPDASYGHATAANILSSQFRAVAGNQSAPAAPPLHNLTDSPTDVESISAPGSWTVSRSPSLQSAKWPYPPRLEDPETDETVDKQRNSHAYHFDGDHSPSLSQLLLARSVGRTPRLRYLISYYAEVIAPVIVAFDSPTNPFRTSILRMAEESTSLQEAIATLSTSNMRQRRERGVFSTGRTEPARMSSIAHRALTDDSLAQFSDPGVPEGFAREEQYHRGMAVKELNKELADPQRRLSDSVLATLLMLCLFHVCDTGVGQFKTQFAGVTKLLEIRLRASPYMSEELKWFIRMFTWYDTMTATTNDREIQLHSRYVHLTAASDGEWCLENIAGCDAGLFGIISHLGRLNILSQGQQPHTQLSPHIFIPTSAPPPSMSYYGLEAGFSGLPAQANPYLFPLPTPPRQGDQTRQPSSPDFWTEWFAIKQQLEAWRFPQDRFSPGQIETGPAVSPMAMHAYCAYMSPPSSPLSQHGVAPQNVEDVFHISESFRHSALLYSERLAYPNLPSSHPRIQHIVQCSMAHMLAVKSDVYLLWPLFITGSESVIQEHRAIIQERCRDISKDSGFYNNLSCLELLEKIWAENPAMPVWMHEDNNSVGTTTGSVPTYPLSWSVLDETISIDPTVSKAQGFRWHQAMQAKRAEEEYMVV